MLVSLPQGLQALQTRTRGLQIRGIGESRGESPQGLSFGSLVAGLAILLRQALKYEVPRIDCGILLRQRRQGIHL